MKEPCVGGVQAVRVAWLRAGNLQGLFHIEDQPLEVFAFRVVDVHGMVGRLCELVEYAHAASCLCGGREHGEPELFAGHGL